jgi:subtilase family serine protease
MLNILMRPALILRWARLVCLFVAFGFLSPTPVIFAAGFGTKTLSGHVPAVVAHLSSRGTLPATNRLNLAIGLPLRDGQGLDDYLAQLCDPASRYYRQYLTPEQFTEKFGPAEMDYAAVIAFAQQNHLTVTTTYGNRLLLDVSGSVADVQQAFHVTLRVYRHPTEARDFYAPDMEPSVDGSLPIADISGLNNYVLPHPKSLAISPSSAGANAIPKSGSGSGGTFMGNDFRAAYLPGVTLTGSGQMAGLLEFDGYYASDISGYETSAGLPAAPLQTVLLDGYDGVPTVGPNSGNGEVSLDIEMAVCMAPGLSRIVIFEAGPNGLQNDILNAMAASNHISQFSCSWGWGDGPSTTTDNIFKQMAAQGQSFFNAAGDSDAFTTGSYSVNGVDNPSINNAPSSCPYITIVGGTTLTTTGPGGSWSSETVWNWGLHKGSYVGGSGGISSFYSIPSWQANVSMAANGGSTANRNVPDVALAADNIYVQYGDGSSGTFGGTSCAAPLWAGLAALMNEQSLMAGRPAIGFVNPVIYTIGLGTGYHEGFHDITTGNNTSPNSPDGFYAVTGYDLCTGWGTPAGQSLINAIAGPPDSLGISPATGFAVTGTVGGSFDATSTTFLLTNSGATSLAWNLINTSAWLKVSSNGGILAVDSSTSVTASLNVAASNLAAGNYTAGLKFTNQNSHVVQDIPFSLNIVQSLVQNGGFETGDFTGWTLAGNTTVFTPFGTTVYNAVENLTNYPMVVHSGNFGAFLGDVQLATLSQALATIPGEQYLLSFWLDDPTNGGLQQFQVDWNGSNIYSITDPPAFLWTNLQFIVTAANLDTLLQFGAENDLAYFGLDDVRLTYIPSIVFKAVLQTPGSFDLTWSAAAGLVYQVQYKTNLLQSNWLNLTKPLVATTNTLTVSDTGSSPRRFYRVIAAP